MTANNPIARHSTENTRAKQGLAISTISVHCIQPLDWQSPNDQEWLCSGDRGEQLIRGKKNCPRKSGASGFGGYLMKSASRRHRARYNLLNHYLTTGEMLKGVS